MRLIKDIFILLSCIAAFITVICDAYAEINTYSIVSQIKNKSLLSKSLFKNDTPFTKYYKKKRNIYVFSRNEETASSLNSFASQMYKKIAKDINLSLIKRDSLEIVIFVVNNQLWEQLKLPEHASAIYLKGFNEMYVRIYGKRRDVFGSLVHEMTHLIIDNMGRKVPLWFEEGISQFEQQQFLNNGTLQQTIHYSEAKLKNIIQSQNLDLENLISIYTYSYVDIKLFYELSYQLINLIHKKGSLHSFANLYLTKGLSFISSMKQSVDYQLNNYGSVENELKTFILNL